MLDNTHTENAKNSHRGVSLTLEQIAKQDRARAAHKAAQKQRRMFLFQTGYQAGGHKAADPRTSAPN